MQEQEQELEEEQKLEQEQEGAFTNVKKLSPTRSTAQCVLLGPNYTNYLVCPEPPSIFMNPVHHLVKMA